MRWITGKQARAAAAESDLAALECSLKHWQQLRDAPIRSLIRKASKCNLVGYYFCSCCLRHANMQYSSDGCPLVGVQRKGREGRTCNCCDGFYVMAAVTLGSILKWGERGESTAIKHAMFVKAAGAVVVFIERKLNELADY